MIIQPETLLRWHRAGFRLLWRHTSKPAPRTRRVAPEIVALIQQLARENRLWGAKGFLGVCWDSGAANLTQVYTIHYAHPALIGHRNTLAGMALHT